MVTLISQFPNQFELHLRAILELPIPSIELAGPAASAVILADDESDTFAYDGIADALSLGAPGNPVDLRIFAKPTTLKNRRMGIALARDDNIEDAIAARQGCSRTRSHSLFGLKETEMRGFGMIALAGALTMSACGDSGTAGESGDDQGALGRAGTLKGSMP